LALARVFAREVWNLYAGQIAFPNFLIEIKEKEEGALSIICRRLVPWRAPPDHTTSEGLLPSTPE